jgi:hypothetical protein
MKQTVIFASLLFIFASCTDTPKGKSHISVSALVDITDARMIYPDPEAYVALFGLGKDESPEATFRITTMTDRETNEDIELWLPGEAEAEKENTNEDVHFRKRQVVTFYKAIRDTTAYFLKAHTKSDTALRYSECFKAIASELSQLKAAGPTTATLLVFSDLQENSALFNCYSAAGQVQLLKGADGVVKRFDDSKLLPATLSNMAIYFVYKPLSREDDARFTAMVKVYRKLLEKRGASIHVQAQNKRFAP